MIDGAPYDAYPSAGRLCVCGQAIKPTPHQVRQFCSNRCKAGRIQRCQCGTIVQRSRSGMCGQCWRAGRPGRTKRMTMAMAGLMSAASQLPSLPTTMPLHGYTCCGWLVRSAHDRTTQRHRIGVNSYMRNRYRTDITWQLSHLLGTASKTEQAKLPPALYTVALTRRRMMEAARLVGLWRTTDGQVSNDPSRTARGLVGPDPQD
jgi:hypothetical protein